MIDENALSALLKALPAVVDGIPLDYSSIPAADAHGRGFRVSWPTEQPDQFALAANTQTHTDIDLSWPHMDEDGVPETFGWQVRVITPLGVVPTVDDVTAAARMCLAAVNEFGPGEIVHSKAPRDRVETRRGFR